MPRGREWPLLGPALFGGALVAYGASLPLGLGRAGAGTTLARSLAVGGDVPAGSAPLALLMMRLCAYLPLGDPGTKAALAAALAGALAAALAGRLALELLASVRAASAPHGQHDQRWAEPLAAAGGALAVASTLGIHQASTAIGSAAFCLPLVLGAALLMVRVARAPARARSGAALALVAGLAAGLDASIAPLLWPASALVTLRALRRGERWPVVAPLLFVAGLGVALAPVAATDGGLPLARVVSALWPDLADPQSARAGVLEVGEQLGVIAVLLVGVGLGVLVMRAWAAALFVIGTMAAGVLLSGAALLAATAITAVPLAAGIVHVAAKLGRARSAAAAALAVMALVTPALDGGARRWSTDARLPLRLALRALEGVPVAGAVDPGSPEMTALLRYAAALGLRPDLRPWQR